MVPAVLLDLVKVNSVSYLNFVAADTSFGLSRREVITRGPITVLPRKSPYEIPFLSKILATLQPCLCKPSVPGMLPVQIFLEEEPKRMKITQITTTIVNAKMRNWVIVRVFTNVSGLIGIGEATVEFQSKAVVGAVSDLAPLLVGRDPRDIERNWQILYRHPFFKGGVVTMSALSGIDQALWDITAKDQNVPLYRVLGGLARDRVRMYDHLGGGDGDAVYDSDSVDSFREKMQESVNYGFTAVKILAVPKSAPLGDAEMLRHAEELMETARDTAGPNVDIMIDFHGRTSAAMAIQYARVFEKFNPYFLEEVVQPDHLEAMKRARSGINVPLASGERLLTRFDFLPLLQNGLIDVAQPDVCHAGEFQKSVALRRSVTPLVSRWLRIIH
jgi:galactonate dehydratase